MKHWVLWAAATFASAQAVPQASVEAVVATIDTVSVLNERIEAELEFVDLSHGGRATRGRSGQPVKLTRSLYLIHVHARGFAKRTTVLRLDGDTKRFRLGLSVSRLSDLQGEPSIRGKIQTSGDRRGSLWVRVTALMNQHDTEEVAVGVDGSFAFEALPPGEYALLVIEKDRLLVSRQVSCFGAVRLEIPIGDR